MPRLTGRKPKPLRRAPLQVDTLVAEVAHERSEPITAYEVVDILAGRGERVAAQQVYRSLKRLRSEGVVRRIESLNAYCAGREDGQAILYCELCGSHRLLRVNDLMEELRELAQTAGYSLSRTVIELCGQCGKCVAPSQSEGEGQ